MTLTARRLQTRDTDGYSPEVVARKCGLRLRLIVATLGKRFDPTWAAEAIVGMGERRGLTGPSRRTCCHHFWRRQSPCCAYLATTCSAY